MSGIVEVKPKEHARQSRTQKTCWSSCERNLLVGARIDWLRGPVLDLQTIVKDLQEKGASLKTTEQTIDTSTFVRKRFLDMLSALSEFVTFLHKERPAEGIAKGKKKGVYKGRKPTVDVDAVCRMKAKGKGATTIAKELKIGRTSVYRVLDTKTV